MKVLNNYLLRKLKQPQNREYCYQYPSLSLKPKSVKYVMLFHAKSKKKNVPSVPRFFFFLVTNVPRGNIFRYKYSGVGEQIISLNNIFCTTPAKIDSRAKSEIYRSRDMNGSHRTVTITRFTRGYNHGFNHGFYSGRGRWDLATEKTVDDIIAFRNRFGVASERHTNGNNDILLKY